MLGTTWAEEKKPVWIGSAPAAGSDSGSVAGSDYEWDAPAPVAPPVPVMGVTDARIAALEAENAALKAENAALKETVAAMKAARVAALKKIAALQAMDATIMAALKACS